MHCSGCRRVAAARVTRKSQLQERPNIGNAVRAWGPQRWSGLASDRARTRAAQGRAVAGRPLPRGGAGPQPPVPPTSRRGAASTQALGPHPLAFPAARCEAYGATFTQGASSQAVAVGLWLGRKGILQAPKSPLRDF